MARLRVGKRETTRPFFPQQGETRQATGRVNFSLIPFFPAWDSPLFHNPPSLPRIPALLARDISPSTIYKALQLPGTS